MTNQGIPCETKIENASYEEGFQLLGIELPNIQNPFYGNCQISPDARVFSIYSALQPCKITSGSNAKFAENKNAKLG